MPVQNLPPELYPEKIDKLLSLVDEMPDPHRVAFGPGRSGTAMMAALGISEADLRALFDIAHDGDPKLVHCEWNSYGKANVWVETAITFKAVLTEAGAARLAESRVRRAG